MGCAVNGPGEAGDADFGIAGGRDVGFVYAHGRVLKKVSSDILDRRALPRDRPLDRRGHGAAEAAQARQARRGDDGRGRATAGRRQAGSGDCNRIADLAARASQLFIPTLREDPGRRRGRQPSAAAPRRLHPPGGAGVYSFLPLGWRVHQKAVQIIREEMDAIGGQEMLMPVLTPAELWQTDRPLRHPGALQARGPGRAAGSSSR